MTLHKKILAAALFTLLTVFAHATAAQAYYYINNEGEYIVWLPDAPTGESIWADGDGKIPLLDKPPKFGTLGEYAEVLRTDPDTGDTFDVHITFLKADRDFLLSLTQEKMYKALHDAFSDIQLSNTEEHFSKGTDTLKWATYIGYSVDKKNNLHYNAAHYLVGQSSIELVRISYSLDNKTYQAYYDKLLKSIKYTGK
jgi:hypothetical protein